MILGGGDIGELSAALLQGVEPDDGVRAEIIGRFELVYQGSGETALIDRRGAQPAPPRGWPGAASEGVRDSLPRPRSG